MKLIPHPETRATGVKAVDGEAWREGAHWHFRYRVEGTGALIVPAPQPPGRADGLWQHLCLEAFVATGGETYVEFNLSPSGRWAAYQFDNYRAGARHRAAKVFMRVERLEDALTVEAVVECAALVAGAPLGLSAVIEEARGTSYWALRHPPGRPDFHDRACFTAVLPDIGRP